MAEDGGKPWEGHPDGPFAGLHAWIEAKLAEFRSELRVPPAVGEPEKARTEDVAEARTPTWPIVGATEPLVEPPAIPVAEPMSNEGTIAPAD